MQIEKTVSFWNCQRTSVWEATIKDTQLGPHCSDTCLSLSQYFFKMVFSVELSQVWGQYWKGHGKGGWRPHVNVIRSIARSSNVTDCSLNVVLKLKLFIFIFHHVLKWCHFCLLCQNKMKLAELDWILVFLKHWEALVSCCLWYCLSVLS